MTERSRLTEISISTGTMVRIFLFVLGIFLLWTLWDIAMVLLTAIVVSSFVESATPFFKRMRINRVFGIVILYIVCIAVFSGLFYLFAPLLITEIYNFSTFLSSHFPDLSFLDYFKNPAFSGAKDVVVSLSENFSLENLARVSQAFIQNLSGGFVQTISVAFGSIFNVILIVLISFYLSVQENGIENFLRLVTPLKNEEYVVNLWQRSKRKIALWFKGQLLLSLIVMVLVYLVLALLGIKYALLLALIAGLMELVPYGVILALIPAASFSYLDGGLSSALMVTGAYLIIHEFEAFLFTPLVINQVVGLSPIVVILSALIGFELGGIWGLLLAIPVAIFLMELLSDLEKHKAFSKTANVDR